MQLQVLENSFPVKILINLFFLGGASSQKQFFLCKSRSTVFPVCCKFFKCKFSKTVFAVQILINCFPGRCKFFKTCQNDPDSLMHLHAERISTWLQLDSRTLASKIELGSCVECLILGGVVIYMVAAFGGF